MTPNGRRFTLNRRPSFWAPIATRDAAKEKPGELLRAVKWFEIRFGWMGSLMLIAILTNLVKKD